MKKNLTILVTMKEKIKKVLHRFPYILHTETQTINMELHKTKLQDCKKMTQNFSK